MAQAISATIAVVVRKGKRGPFILRDPPRRTRWSVARPTVALFCAATYIPPADGEPTEGKALWP